MIKFYLFLLVSTSMIAHDYYFAFAEVSYNEESKKIEATLTISTHDLERSLKKEHPEIGDIGTMQLDSNDSKIITNYLLAHFKVKGKVEAEFKLIGLESNLKGMTNFYLESEPVELKESITVHFDLLMETYQEQQNKITFYHKGNSYTKPFLYTQRIQIINLNK